METSLLFFAWRGLGLPLGLALKGVATTQLDMSEAGGEKRTLPFPSCVRGTVVKAAVSCSLHSRSTHNWHVPARMRIARAGDRGSTGCEHGSYRTPYRLPRCLAAARCLGPTSLISLTLLMSPGVLARRGYRKCTQSQLMRSMRCGVGGMDRKSGHIFGRACQGASVQTCEQRIPQEHMCMHLTS